MLVAGFGDLFGDVPPERGVHDVVAGILRIEVAEAVMMLGGPEEISGAGRLHQPDPLLGIEISRFQQLVLVVVDLPRDALGHLPFFGAGPPEEMRHHVEN